MNQLPRKENKHRLKLMEKLENRKRPRSLSQLPGLKKSLKIQVGLMKMMSPMMQPTLIKLLMRKEPKKKTKKFIPKKVFTPGSFIDNQSVENSSDSDEDVAGSNDETISGKVANAGRAEKQTKKPRPGSFIENLTVATSESDSDEH